LVEYYQTDIHLVKPDIRKHPDSRQDLYNLRLVSRIWTEPPLVFINERLRLQIFTTTNPTSAQEYASAQQSLSPLYAYYLAVSRHAHQVLHLHIDIPFKNAFDAFVPEVDIYLEALTRLVPVLWKFTRLETLVVTHNKYDFLGQGCLRSIPDSNSQDLLDPDSYFNQIFSISRGLHYSVRELSRLRHLQLAIPIAWSVDEFFRPPTKQLNLAFSRLEHLNIRVCIQDREAPLHFLAQCNSLKTLSLTMEHDSADSDLKIELDNVPWDSLTRLEGLCLRSTWMKAVTLFGILRANRHTLRKLEMIKVSLTSGRWAAVFATINRGRYPLLRSLRVLPLYDRANGLAVHPTVVDGQEVRRITARDGSMWADSIASIYKEGLRDSPPWRGPDHVRAPLPNRYQDWLDGNVGCDSVGADTNPMGRFFGAQVPPAPERRVGAFLEEEGLRLPDTIGPWRPLLVWRT